jgi:hypothetical protein
MASSRCSRRLRRQGGFLCERCAGGSLSGFDARDYRSRAHHRGTRLVATHIPAYQSREEELADLKRCIAALEMHSAARPLGWISPRATPSLNTPELLAQERMSWIADVFDQDLPYVIDTKEGKIIGIPFTTDVNDFPLCIRYGNEPDAYVHVLRSLIEGWSEIRNPPACIDLTAHAHVFGRPSGAIAFKSAIRLAQQSTVVWMTHHAELAKIWASDPT